MSWKCPGCTSAIPRGEGVSFPTVGIIYRCSVCHLDLIFDPKLKKMRPAPPIPPRKSKSKVA